MFDEQTASSLCYTSGTTGHPKGALYSHRSTMLHTERPLLVVVKKPGGEVTRDALLAFYEGKIAKWWTPDDVVFVDAIPLGATGKMQKNKLREQLADYKLPSA